MVETIQCPAFRSGKPGQLARNVCELTGMTCPKACPLNMNGPIYTIDQLRFAPRPGQMNISALQEKQRATPVRR